MKALIKVEKEIYIKTLILQVEPRHIGDSEDDDISPLFPGLAGGILTLEIDIETGVIKNWPDGQEHSAYMKVCDTGSYYLNDSDGHTVAQIEENYVPNLLIPGDYGDYINLKVDGSGKIDKWPSSPDISEFFDKD